MEHFISYGDMKIKGEQVAIVFCKIIGFLSQTCYLDRGESYTQVYFFNTSLRGNNDDSWKFEKNIWSRLKLFFLKLGLFSFKISTQLATFPTETESD